MAQLSRSAGMLVMVAGLVLVISGVFLALGDSTGVGVACLAAGAAAAGVGYIIRSKATA